MARTVKSDRRVGRTPLAMAINARLRPDQVELLQARAEDNGTSVSEELRTLLDLGGIIAHGLDRGFAISDDVQGLIAKREPIVMTIAPDPEDPVDGPTWLVTPEEVARDEETRGS